MISVFAAAGFRCAPLSSSSRARVTFDACARGTSTRVHLAYNEGRLYTSLSTGLMIPPSNDAHLPAFHAPNTIPDTPGAS